MQFVLYRVIWLPEYSFKLRFWLGTEEAFCDHIWVLHRDEKKCKKIYLIHITVPQLASFTIMNTYCLTSLLDWLDNWNVRLIVQVFNHLFISILSLKIHLSEGRVQMPVKPATFFVCPKPGHTFPTIYVMFFWCSLVWV
jgi:hypothetical protein